MPIEDYEGCIDDEDEIAYSDSVIDPVWEQQQKKTFTAWCNAQLRKANEQIESIESDFRNGLKLMKLLEVISGEKLDKPERGKMRFHKIANVNKALNFIESKGVKLVSIGAEEIVDGNVKMTLGMIWTIVLRFAIQDILIEDVSAKEGLLLWCRRQAAPYGVRVDNFHTSFKDGLAFCAIIHRNRPKVLDFYSLDKNDHLTNLNLAFDVAEDQLDIPRMLDVDDMLNSIKSDERSVMAYVSSYYHKFAGENKTSMAVNRITNMLKPMRENERLVEDCQLLSGDLLDWILQRLKYFENRVPLTTVKAAEDQQLQMRNYFQHEKPSKLQEKARMETTYNTLQTRLRLYNRLTTVPEIERLISNVSHHWNELEVADKAFESWISEELQRVRRMEYLVKKFEVRCATHEAWAKGKPEYLVQRDYLAANPAELRAMKKKLEAFQSELQANCDRIERIEALRNELVKVRFHDMKSIDDRVDVILASTNRIRELSDYREQEIDRLLPILDEIDSLHLEFAKKSVPFKNWMDQTEEDLRDDFVVHTSAELEGLVNSNEAFRSTLDGTEVECEAMHHCVAQVESLAKEHELTRVSDNPYTNISPSDLLKRWSNVKQLSLERTEWLHEEERRQAKNDVLRAKFAQKAAEFVSWIEQQKDAIHRHMLDARGTLQEQCARLKHTESALREHRNMLDELEQCNQQLEDAFVYDNPATPHSMPLLRVAWNQLFTLLQYSVNELENQMLIAESKGLTEEQMMELSECFKHFDKDDSRRLEPKEFKSCLVSLGHKFRDDLVHPVNNLSGSHSALPTLDESDLIRIMAEVDPSGKGYVTFDAFLNFMARQNADDNTEEQIVHSFRTLAGEKGYVTDEDIRTYLSPDDAMYCLKHMAHVDGPIGDSGALNYKAFVVEMHVSRKTMESTV